MKFKLIVALSTAILLAGCEKTPEEPQPQASTPAVTETQTATTKQSSPATLATYKMAVEASGQPFTFKDESGKLTGFDVDLINAIGEKQGFKVETFAHNWDTIFETLNDDKSDIVASGVAISDERLQKMDFSEPYMDSYMAVAFISPDIKSYADLTHKKVGAQVGTNYGEFAKANFANAKEFPTMFLAYKAMLKNEADAVIDDVNMINSQNVRSGFDNVKVMKVPNTENDHFAFAIKKGRSELVNQINEGLKQVKTDGTYDKIYAKWFGSTKNIINASATSQ